MSSPTVLLSPRPKVRLPTVDIDIPPPPPVPARPGGSLLYQILPVLLAAVGMGVILVVSNAQGSSGTLAVLMLGSLLLVGGGAGATLLMHRSQNAAYHRGLRERLELYYRMLASTRDRLLELLDEQRRTLLDKDPEPDACASIAHERGPRLWERSPSDSDFLVLRAGLGAQPSSVAVRAPRQPDPLVPDPLVEGAAALAAWASSVWSVPVSVSLVDAASTGVCGPSPVVLETVRALLVQLVTHHAPDEVKLVALVPHAEMTDWAWLRWLPHVWSDDRRERYIATTPDESRTLSKRLEELLGRRRDLFAGFGAERSNGRLSTPVYVFLIADAGLADHMPLLAEISASEISRLGATCLFLAPDRRLLPRACRTIVELSEDGADGRLVRPDGDVQGISALDLAPLPLVEQLATALASLQPRRLASPSALPSHVPILPLLGVEAVEALDVLDRWRRACADRSLAVPIGVRPGGEQLRLDLHQRADGPHGLVAGSTGSGKSAFLQALLLSLAASFHPHDLAMVLVDYKGGSTVGPLRDLPHVLGIITNLDGNLAHRALVALQAEIERRQAVLTATACDDLDEYLVRCRHDSSLQPIPHLVLVVDEFAELKTERPDFIHQLIRAARVGRSVGLHLILATQKPRPAVDDEIWANARFRVCLRVEQPQDSHDVLKRPDAASLSGRGQGYLQIGHDELFTLFQGTWSGAPYRPEAGATDPREILQVDLDGTRRAIGLHLANADRPRDPTQAEALARRVRRAADQAGIATLPSIYGAPGAGKTTALVTLAVSLARDHAPSDVNLYLLDWGGQALTSLAVLPHVGGVVLGDEEEKLQRLLRHLIAELGRRKAAFGAVGVSTLHAYRAASGTGLPAVVVLIDNLPALLHAYPDVEDQIAQIAQQGGTLGIYLAITAVSPLLVRLRIANGFGQALALHLIDRADYGAVLSLPEGYEPTPLPGRGVIKGRPTLECQVALPADGAGEAEQTAAVRRWAEAMDQAWSGTRPWRVRTLPELVTLHDLLPLQARADGAPVAAVGLGEDELEPLRVDLRDGPHFAISGPPRGGKSTLLRAWLLGLLANVPADRRRLYLADLSGAWSGFEPIPGVCYCDRGTQLPSLLEALECPTEAGVTRVLAIDDLDGLLRSADAEALQRLAYLIRERRSTTHVLLVGSSAAFGASYDGVGQAIKDMQTGFIVGGSDYEDLQVLGIAVPHAEASQGLPPGRAFYARRKRYVRLKVADPS